MWNRETLQELVDSRLRPHQFVVAANREPFQHCFMAGRIECVRPASGMVTALDPILRACGGVWVAHGSGNADRQTTNRHGRIRVPPDDPCYTLRRVWLAKEEEDGFYNGVANAGLWPLCHTVFTRPEFNPRDWPIYRRVNEKFADAILEEVGDAPAFVFVQDYHFGLLPRLLKDRASNLIVAQFWHIPWPSPEVFQVCPWKEELLDGLLGNDLLGFHLRYHCQNFLDTVDRILEAKVDYERFDVTRAGKGTLVRPFPISIDFEGHAALAASPAVEVEMIRWREQLRLGDERLGIGIDRLDYTKGIPERLQALDRLLEQHPEHREQLVFVQLGVPSRMHNRHYQALVNEIDDLVESLNWKWGTESWEPIVYFKQQKSPVEMAALHRLADFCVVNALDDGLNLVAKEFAASRIDDDGVLILSRFTGSARELGSAVLVNPFDIDQTAEAMHHGLLMPEEERRKRMQKMRAAVAENNVFRWAGKFLSTLLQLELPEPARVNGDVVYQNSWGRAS
jgi:trehalose 6-phosphate synthase